MGCRSCLTDRREIKGIARCNVTHVVVPGIVLCRCQSPFLTAVMPRHLLFVRQQSFPLLSIFSCLLKQDAMAALERFSAPLLQVFLVLCTLIGGNWGKCSPNQSASAPDARFGNSTRIQCFTRFSSLSLPPGASQTFAWRAGRGEDRGQGLEEGAPAVKRFVFC